MLYMYMYITSQVSNAFVTQNPMTTKLNTICIMYTGLKVAF